jgi:hypothetical protein
MITLYPEYIYWFFHCWQTYNFCRGSLYVPYIRRKYSCWTFPSLLVWKTVKGLITTPYSNRAEIT